MVESAKVAEHYEGKGLIDRVKDALAAAGFTAGRIAPAQLASLDQFHSRGLEATIELGKILGPSAKDRVLDIGSGLGGPSRYLASTFGSHVTGIDLSDSFVEAATFLAEKTGLTERVNYMQGNALSLPFESGSFDIAWTQHVAMNIADRDRFYSEAYRVLKAGGRIAIYDVLQGGGGPLIYPVPWSKSEETSFLLTPAGMKSQLVGAGFEISSWVDRTDAALAWFAQLRKSQASIKGPGPLGLHLAMGPEFKTMTANLARNLDEGRAVLVETIGVKRSGNS